MYMYIYKLGLNSACKMDSYEFEAVLYVYIHILQ